MPISTEADDLAKNLEDVRGTLRELQDIVSGWTRSGNTYIDTPVIRASQAEFVTPALESMRMRITTDVAVATNVWTKLAWDTMDWNTLSMIRYDSTALFFEYIRPGTAECFLFFGHIEFEQNSSAFRALLASSHGIPGTTRSGTVLLAQRRAADGAPTVLPFAYVYGPDLGLPAVSTYFPGVTGGFGTMAYQNRGGTLQVTSGELNVVRIARWASSGVAS